MNEDPNTLKINVTDDVGTVDVGPGGAQKEEDPVARQREMEMEYLTRYVAPHNKPSRPVEEADIPHMMEESKVMLGLCMIGRGHFGSAAAIAHSQIEAEDPLRFFVMAEGHLIVNPVIYDHTKQYVDKKEGCMSFPGELMKVVQRFNKTTVRFQVVNRDEKDPNKLVLSDWREEHLSGHLSNIFQHEVSHLNGVSIYDENYTPEKAIGIILPEDVDKDEKTHETEKVDDSQ